MPLTTRPSGRPASLAARSRLLLLGTTLPALLLTAAPGTALAQAFNGTPTGTGFSRAVSPGAETITVNGSGVIINWTPTDTGPVANFLPQGNVATFQNGASNPDFSVLNRIIPQTAGQTIAFNGRVISQLQSAAAGTVRGGTVAFYTPNGIIIGSTAVFDVGNLVLTTLDPQRFPIDGNPARFAAVNPASSITISPGAQINATAANSYLAVLSPRIAMGGAVRVNGSTAYIGAETVDLAINSGLFTIIVTTGSGDATPIVHTGSTGGPASTGAGDNHQIAMVAVPKNQAITMLLSGSLGYDAAASAAVENGVITLSSGHNLFSTFFADEVGPTQLDSNIRFDGGTVTSDLEARSRGSTVIESSQTPFSATGDVRLLGRSSAELIARGPSGLITIGGKLQAAAYSNSTGVAGLVRLAALQGGTVSVAGTTDLRADSFQLFNRPAGAPIVNVGGTATIEANGGTINFGNNVTLAADGNSEGTAVDQFGGSVAVRSGGGGIINVTGNLTAQAGTLNFAGARSNARGGTASLRADAGQISVSGALTVNASAFGPSAGGDGTGGAASLNVRNNGQVTANTASVQALGGGAGASAAGVGASGTGGAVDVTTESGGTLTVNSQLSADAGGFGAAGTAAGGNGLAGSVRVGASGNGRVSAGHLQLQASANGGGGTAGSAVGGNATAGVVALNATSGGRITANSANLIAGTFGGNGIGSGGTARSGTIELRADGSGSQLNIATTLINIQGQAGTSQNARGGDAIGDEVVFEASNGGLASIGALSLFGTMFGAAGLTGGGNATASDITISAVAGGRVTLTPSGGINSSAIGGAARDQGGSAQGGATRISAQGPQSQIAFSGATNINTFAQGGAGNGVGTGMGGNGASGTFQISAAQGGTVTAGGLNLSNQGQGGTGRVRGGSAQSGTLDLIADGSGSAISATSTSASTAASAGSSQNGAGGNAIGNRIGVAASNGAQIALGAATLTTAGFGAAGQTTGGNGTGGAISVAATGGGQVTATTANLNAFGSGQLGNSAGGTAQGGAITVQVAGAGSKFTSTSLSLSAFGTGGSGPIGLGGAATGGTVSIDVAGGGNLTTGGVSANSDGNGGAGASGGGAGQAGGVQMLVTGSGSSFTSTSLFVQSSGSGGASQNAGGGAGTGAAALINVTNAGQVSAGVVNVLARGTGGAGATGGGTGRAAAAELRVAGAGSTFTATSTTLSSVGFGGASANAAGGAGIGASTLLDVTAGGQVNLGAGTLDSAAVGGNGATTGGGGTGGVARINVAGGSAVAATSLLVNANAFGGTGPTAGGTARSGLAEVRVAGAGSSLTAASATLISFSTAGASANGRGGDATSDRIILDASGGGRISLGSNALLDVGARGGAGRTGGGDGQAGNINLAVVGDQSLVDVGGTQFRVFSFGTGGTGTTGGRGIGGSIATVVDLGGVLRAGQATNSFFEAGGTGGNSVGTAVGQAGVGQAGSVSHLVDRGGLAEFGAVTSLTDGRGGAYQAAPGGAAGDGLSGPIQLLVTRDGIFRTTNTPAGGSALFAARGIGGASSVAGSRGGNGVGGTVSLGAVGGTLSSTSTIQAASFGSAGVGPARSGDGTGGASLVFAEAGGAITARSLLVQATGQVLAGTAQTGGTGRGGSATLRASGGSITVTGAAGFATSLLVDASATGGTADPTGGGGDAIAGTSRIIVEQGGSVTASADPNLRTQLLANATGGAGLSGGTATGGTASVEVGSAAAAGSTLAARSLEVRSTATGGAGSSGGAALGGISRIQAQRGSLAVTGAVDIFADAIAGGSAAAPGNAQFGGVTIDLADSNATFGALTMQALGRTPRGFPGGPTLAGITLNNSTLSVLGNSGINYDGAVLLRATGASSFATGGDFAIGARDDVAFEANGAGRFTVGGSLTVTGGPSTDIRVTHANRPANAATIQAGNINFSGNDIDTRGALLKAADSLALTALDDLVVGDLEADGSIALSLAAVPAVGDPNQMEIAGRVVAPQIAIRSADLVIAQTGQIGARGVTQSVTLTVASDQQTVIGGDATPGRAGYTLDRGEIGRIRSTALRIEAPAAAGGAPLLVRDVDLPGSANNDGFRSVELAAAGTVRVEGAVSFSGAAADDRLTISAARIQVPVPAGSIRIRDASGNPSGVLELAADDIAVASDDLLDDLDGLSAAERNAALRSNNGALDPRGYIEAGTVRLLAGRSVSVQNTGSITQPGGVTTGSGGLFVERTGSVPIAATLFGARLAGGQVTSGDAFFEATFGKGVSPGAFTDESELNLTNINSRARTISRDIAAPSAAAITASLPPPTDFDQLALEQDGAEEGGGSSFGSARQYLVDLTALSRDELIDEPVAGSSDSTTWGEEDEDEDEEEEEEGAEAPPVPARGGGE